MTLQLCCESPVASSGRLRYVPSPQSSSHALPPSLRCCRCLPGPCSQIPSAARAVLPTPQGCLVLREDFAPVATSKSHHQSISKCLVWPSPTEQNTRDESVSLQHFDRLTWTWFMTRFEEAAEGSLHIVWKRCQVWRLICILRWYRVRPNAAADNLPRDAKELASKNGAYQNKSP